MDRGHATRPLPAQVRHLAAARGGSAEVPPHRLSVPVRRETQTKTQTQTHTHTQSEATHTERP